MIFGDIIYLPHNTIKTLEEAGGVFNGDIGIAQYTLLGNFIRYNLLRLNNKLSKTPESIALLFRHIKKGSKIFLQIIRNYSLPSFFISLLLHGYII